MAAIDPLDHASFPDYSTSISNAVPAEKPSPAEVRTSA
jgi:hypothetical protein